VRIDMEDSSTTDATLRLYRELRQEGRDNVGVVLQAMLRRTDDDIAALADLKPSVRLCKGIYVEPPELAYQDFDEVRDAYVRALEALLDAGSYVGIATHDEWLLDEGRRLVAERGLSRDEYEFQMLLGVRPQLGDQLVREGHRLRIYVPFGRHWYAYSLRRLQENPKIAGYIAADTFGRFIGRHNGA
jgi:proline dehydrogenase